METSITYCDRLDIAFGLWSEAQHVSTAVSMVTAGLGLAIVPRLDIDAAGTPGVKAIPLRNPRIVRTLGLLKKRGTSLSPPAEILAGLIEARLKAER